MKAAALFSRWVEKYTVETVPARGTGSPYSVGPFASRWQMQVGARYSF
ncbi:hypothetical protein [Chitinophaga sp.]